MESQHSVSPIWNREKGIGGYDEEKWTNLECYNSYENSKCEVDEGNDEPNNSPDCKSQLIRITLSGNDPSNECKEIARKLDMKEYLPYMQLITPINRTRNLKAIDSLINQKAMMIPAKLNISTQLLQRIYQ
ncbi:13962_t:CDS:2 [Acaulospora colombiana]|uniref:13962_t:CDS:1 n=1 Tax=Acaulospora colombiana TaxID=27376 RepID=A0ACA9PGH6_9GLOM|nr:13962_t:CDS:2 [Acaulospora colombiana]